jgi:phosphoribosylformylglycinamidine synthase
MKPRALVLRAAGSNCDLETQYALELAGALVERVHVNRLLERPDRLAEVDLLAIPGGFTYGDDLGAGRVLGLKLERQLSDALRALVDRGGLVIGICNGFQVLVKAGLLPGTEGVQASLAPNASGKFEARWTRLQVGTSRSPWLKAGDVLDLPVAHAEGRLVLGEASQLAKLQAADLVALRYVSPSDGAAGVAGTLGTSPAGYPSNPAGSTDDVAGLVDETGRVLGLMPHPERNVEAWHRPGWTRGAGEGASGPSAGRRLFERGVAYLQG